jgi:hypothetical protein
MCALPQLPTSNGRLSDRQIQAVFQGSQRLRQAAVHSVPSVH